MELQYRGSGKVYYNSKEYNCDLYYNEKLGGILLKINIRHKKMLGNFLELPLEMPVLCGKLNTGFRFTLLKLTRTGMQDLVSYGTTVYTFVSQYLVCGISNKNNSAPTFHKVQYRLSNIIEWGEESVYQVGELFELTNKKENIRKTLYKDEKFEVSYLVYSSSFPIVNHDVLKEVIKIEQCGLIEVVINGKEDLEYFNKIFAKVKRLIELSTLEKINIEEVDAYSVDVFEKIGNKKIERNIQVYGIDINEYKPKDYKKNRSWKWITITELINHNSFKHYFDKDEKLAPIIELFLEPFYIDKISETKVFLNIVQALETYHSRFITNDMKGFKQRIGEMVKDFSPERAEETRKFILANSKRFITLESRLADLLIADWKIYFDTGEINRTDFSEIIAATRNYYIHYDERIKNERRVLTDEELQIYNRALIQILEYYILFELGFTEENGEFKKRLFSRWGNVSQSLELLRLSRTQHHT